MGLLTLLDSGAVLGWQSESGLGGESGLAVELVCALAAGRAGVTVSDFLSFWGFDASLGPRTFRCELQNSTKGQMCLSVLIMYL